MNTFDRGSVAELTKRISDLDAQWRMTLSRPYNTTKEAKQITSEANALSAQIDELQSILCLVKLGYTITK